MMKRIATLSLALFLSACADDTVGPPLKKSNSGDSQQSNKDGINRTDLLTNLVDNQVLKTLGTSVNSVNGSLVFEATQLQTDTAAYCSAIGSTTEFTALAKAQNQWRNSISLWQQLQMLSVGPLNLTVDENKIYGWPENSVSPCLVHLLAVRNRSNPNYDVSGSTGQVRGFEAVEQVLFASNLTYACNGESPEKSQWQSLNDTQKKQALCNFAKAATKDLSNEIKAIASEWESGTTKTDFINDGDDSLQKIVDSLFNLEKLTKDRKLGVPTGLHNDCDAKKVSCPELVESRLSANSIANIRSNIKGFLAVFTGGDNGLGFDDILTARLHKSVSQDIVNKLKSIDEKLANFSGSLEAGVTGIKEDDCDNSRQSPSSIRIVEACAIVGELSEVTDILKTDFTAIVNVNVPTNAAGDGD